MAYADPPYPGQALRHYGGKGDPFEGAVQEVDHAELVERLERDFPDGWALSTSVPALGDLLALCPRPEASKKRTWNGRAGVKLGTGVRVGAWLRSSGSPFPPSRVMWTWEPVIFRVIHWRQRHPHDFVRDSLVASQPHFLGNTIIGQKPVAFCHWVFDVLGLGPDDELVDLFPGSGAVGHAWESWCRQTTIFELAPAAHAIDCDLDEDCACA
jgi:hypothetical protein